MLFVSWIYVIPCQCKIVRDSVSESAVMEAWDPRGVQTSVKVRAFISRHLLLLFPSEEQNTDNSSVVESYCTQNWLLDQDEMRCWKYNYDDDHSQQDLTLKYEKIKHKFYKHEEALR